MRKSGFPSVLMMLGLALLLAACGSSGQGPFGPGMYSVSQTLTGPAFTGPMPNEKLAMAPAAKPVPTMPVGSVMQQGTAGKIFRWTTVGGDPCNPKAGCTLEWTLTRAVATGFMPRDVADEFLRMVPNTPGEEVLLPPGWQGFMTFGKFTPKFELHTLADWKDGRSQPAQKWTIARSGQPPWNLYKVRACGNWGGDRSEAPAGPPTGIPGVFCP